MLGSRTPLEGLVADRDVEVPLAEAGECLTSMFTIVSSLRAALVEEIDGLGGHAA